MSAEIENTNKAPGYADRISSAARGLFLLLIVSLGWMQPFPSLYGHNVTPSDVLFPLVALMWLASAAARRFRFAWHPAFWFFAFYFATMLLSSIFSPAPRVSFIKLAGEAYLLGLAVIGFDLFDTERRIKFAVYAFLAGAAVAVAIGLFALGLFYLQPDSYLLTQLTYHYGAVPVGNYPRISSVFVSASMFCNYLNVAAVLLLIARNRGWIGSVLFWSGLSAVVLCSVFTVSIGLGGIILALGVWVWAFSDRSSTAMRRFALGSAIAGAFAFLVLGFVALLPYRTAPYAIRIPVANAVVYPAPRLLVWSETVQTIRDNPLTGKGLDLPTSAVVFENTEGTTSVLTDAHNTFLSVAAQNGIFSLLAMLGICGYLLFVGVRGRGSGLVVGLTIAFLTAFVYQGLTGAFEDARHLWVLIGVLLAASKLAGGPEQGLTHGTGV